MAEAESPSKIINTEVLNWMRLSKDEETGNPQDNEALSEDIIIEKVSAKIEKIFEMRDKREEKRQKELMVNTDEESKSVIGIMSPKGPLSVPLLQIPQTPILKNKNKVSFQSALRN